MQDKIKEEAKKVGQKSNIFTGKALFKYDPTLFKDDEDAADANIYEERSDEDEEEKKETENIRDGQPEESKEDGTTAVDTDLF